MSGVADAAIVSAAVAGAVTLIIEYAAKPRLELRKERLLQSYRDRLSLHRRLAAVWGMFGRTEVELKHEALPGQHSVVARLDALLSDLDALTAEREYSRHLVPHAVSQELDYQSGYITGQLAQLRAADVKRSATARARRDPADDQEYRVRLAAALSDLGERLELPLEYLGTRPRAYVTRLRLHREFRRRMEMNDARIAARQRSV